MASESSNSTSFSAGRRWGIFFSVLVSIATVFALVLMVNYLGARHFRRFTWSHQARMQLSPQTLALLKFATNDIKVIVYYDKTDKLYGSVNALLDEYCLADPKITVEKVDYLVEASKAQIVKDTYKLGSSEDKNLVIFSSSNGFKVIPEKLLGKYDLIPTGSLSDKGEVMYDRELKAFEGEKWFSAALLRVLNTKPLVACFLEGDGEHGIEDAGHDGYHKFAEVMAENNVEPRIIRLHGTNTIPAECNLLVIAGPRSSIPPEELTKVREYLDQGGRLFLLFNYTTIAKGTGLENLMAEWNVRVGMNVVNDPENAQGSGVVVNHFNPNHSLVAPLQGFSIEMVSPRSIEILNLSKQGPDTPKVDALAYSGPNATVNTNSKPGFIPLMVAVEKGTVKGVFPQRGTTAILVAGDSIFLNNDMIEAVDNRDFAGFAVNWLLDQTQLLSGVGSHPVDEYKLTMTKAQIASVQLLFLVVLPGSILAFGGLVWFRRRH